MNFLHPVLQRWEGEWILSSQMNNPRCMKIYTHFIGESTMLCVGEFPMPPEAEGIKSTRDNLSEVTIASGPSRLRIPT